MYLYIAVLPRDTYYSDGPGRHGLYNARIEEAAGERSLIAPYQEFQGLRTLRELKPRAVVMSGFGPRFEDLDIRDFHGMDEALREADLPFLCICGSHQVAGWCFNHALRTLPRMTDLPMREIGGDERGAHPPAATDPSGRYFKALGFYEIERLEDDPIFANLPPRMTLWCHHYCEVKALPPGFVRLARSGHCAIEAMKHRERCLYGVQFHPEQYESPHLHGRQVLVNFARIVDSFWQAKGCG